jgi:hypothetical protein
MAGFLNAEERVIDLVLTDTGKQLLLKGALRFAYWIPFDDEMNYQPTVTIWNSASYHADLDALGDLIADASRSMLEDPVLREASMGYRGLNANEEDTTNVIRPMYTAAPGVGHVSPLPQMQVSTGSMDVQIMQNRVVKRRVRKDRDGNIIDTSVHTVGVQRRGGTSAYVTADYSTGSFTADKNLEGFLITMYHHVSGSDRKIVMNDQVSGSLHEILHNRNSDGDVVYSNDILLRLER